jgi:hypothetical protein
VKKDAEHENLGEGGPRSKERDKDDFLIGPDLPPTVLLCCETTAPDGCRPLEVKRILVSHCLQEWGVSETILCQIKWRDLVAEK